MVINVNSTPDTENVLNPSSTTHNALAYNQRWKITDVIVNGIQ